MAAALGGYPTSHPASVCQQMRDVLEEGVSLLAIEDNSGEIVGIRSASVLER